MVILFVWVAWKNMMEMGRGGLHMDGWFRLGGLHVNGYFVCMGLRGKIWWRLVGAVPVCPPVSPYKGASTVQFPAHNAYVFAMETSLNSLHTMRVFFVMETPLRGRSGGHTGTAPTVSFGWITRGRLISFGWIAREWLFCLCKIA